MRTPIQRLRAALAVCLALLLADCGLQLPAWHAGKLLVIVPDVSLGAEAAFERELAQRFGEYLHTRIGLISMPPDEIDPALRHHRAHLAAATLRGEISPTALHYGPSYQTVREQVVCNRDGQVPKNLAGLAALRLAALAGSAQETVLREARKTSPALQWQAQRKSSAKKLLQEVAEGTLDCAVVNETHLNDARLYYPNLVAAFDIGTPSRLAWAFPRDVDPALLKEAQDFFARIRQDGTLNRLLDRYYGHDERFAPADASLFVARANSVLPRYRPLFEEAAALTGEDWRLLAALAYQESQWNPLATSFTNVRGMMMLTEDTADRMQVSNRLDARESILAGAKYLVQVREQIPARIPEPDRTWMALAAYNQGYGHVEDARILTQRAGQNPDIWADVKKSMLLLSQPGYYETLKNGYARGGEAAVLVENIRSYYELLKRTQPDVMPLLPEETSYKLFGPMQRLLQRWQDKDDASTR
jgi:membrane-bound lytic murein transglycosylase F